VKAVKAVKAEISPQRREEHEETHKNKQGMAEMSSLQLKFM